LKVGLGAGIDAQIPKGSNLKVTIVIYSSEVTSTLTVMSSLNLLSDHVQATDR
jgi:hypothetical protein